MFRYVFAWILLVSLESFAVPSPQGQDEVTDALNHARALYYEANFDESIQLLSRVDDVLRPRTDRLTDKINVKLQLALAHIGLNDNAEALSFLRQLYELDADYALDPQQFSPKVLALAEDARAEQIEARCRTVRDNARKQLEAKNVSGVLNLLESMKSKCAGLSELEPATADLLYKTGLESYKRGEYPDALQQFRTVVRLSPQHELATQYLELTESKLQVTADRLLLSWHKNFQAGDFGAAGDDYRRLAALNDPASRRMLDEAREAYRAALTGLVESSNKACANSDLATVQRIRTQVEQMRPEPSVGADVVDQMSACTRRDCVPMGSQLALTRLKVKVDPEIPAALQNFLMRSPVTVRVQTRIDEKGDVIVGEVLGGNPALNQTIRTAVERWKFTPALDAAGPRCVDTEIPIVITP
jgi:tetratricopeptide (TPR) repeat protein